MASNNSRSTVSLLIASGQIFLKMCLNMGCRMSWKPVRLDKEGEPTEICSGSLHSPYFTLVTIK